MTKVAQMPTAPRKGSPEWLLEMICTSESPRTEWVELTPELADALLKINTTNRSIKRVKLAQYTADMAAGRWELNGEPIIISKCGQVNDGQHRCMAVIDSNTTIPVAMTFGIERETRLTVDQGAARSAGDFLAMEGVPNANVSAAIARMLIAYEKNDGKSLNGAGRITSGEIRERVYSDGNLALSATFTSTNQTYAVKFCNGSIIGLCHYILSRKDRDDASAFLMRVCRGDGLKMRDPAHTVREKLISLGKDSRERKIKLILQGWNFHRRGMKVAPSSMSSELPFPAIM